MKSLGVYLWYVKMPRCGWVEHGLEYITFYVQKHIAHLTVCSGPPLARDGPLGAPAFVKLSHFIPRYIYHVVSTDQTHLRINSTMVLRGEWINVANYRMHLFHIPQSFIQNRNVHLSVLNGALWEMEWVHSWICELGQLESVPNGFTKKGNALTGDVCWFVAMFFSGT